MFGDVGELEPRWTDREAGKNKRDEERFTGWQTTANKLVVIGRRSGGGLS